jgi:hypothetical protein
MHTKDPSNHLFQLASDLVNNTGQNLFLTGKAGTGKTTFLRYITANSKKHTVVVAPTGVAAINAGGVTMHSFFQLPFGVFVPGSYHRNSTGSTNVEITDKHSLFKNFRFGKDKRALFEQLELLIIDEVSMMRCDMLDAIDAVLQHFRKNNMPFGGVQVLFIGDLFQLPPVVQNEDWSILQEYYESPFFFSAQALAKSQPLYIELKKIYRQNEQSFIDILNRIRNNVATPADLETLNARYQPQFEPVGESYITITTHNRRADAINAGALQQLPGKSHLFAAEVTGDFNEKSLPTDRELQLKEGAQIMFIKNDPERRYFNGKLATVSEIRNAEITVTFPGGGVDLKLELETWKNIKYTYNKEQDQIDEEELGSFKQYPIRLAWAITIHKSQGLTFERAVIDAGASFAPGQVYVALSRCTSMNGMVLRSRIFPSSIATDPRVISYAESEQEGSILTARLEQEKYKYWAQSLLKLFNWELLVSYVFEWTELIPEKKLPDNENSLKLAMDLLSKAREGSETARKFQVQLSRITEELLATGDTTILWERMGKAILYFAAIIADGLLKPVQQHIKDLATYPRIKRYKEQIHELEGFLWARLQQLLTASYGELTFFNDFARFQEYHPGEHKGPATKVLRGKVEKGMTYEMTYELFRAGKPVEEIATIRNLAPGTIETHLAHLVREGRLHITEVVGGQKLEDIVKVMDEVGTESIVEIKNRLGEEYSYGDIRAVLSHRSFAQKIGA